MVKRIVLALGLVLGISGRLWASGLDDFNVHGFIEHVVGFRLNDNADVKRDNLSIGEVRGQLKGKLNLSKPQVLDLWYAQFSFKADFVENYYWQARSGIDLRECVFSFSPLGWVDIKAGRQVLTWGVGKYIFINDLFPKSYVSFYSGRDEEYLKLPSDALRMSFYWDVASLDVVWLPDFKPNNGPEGVYLEGWDPYLMEDAGERRLSSIVERENGDEEIAMRLFGNMGRYEWATYYFNGFYKDPVGFLNQGLHQIYYPALSVYGFSLRGPFYRGIASMEFGYYLSEDDEKGVRRDVPNSQLRFLFGYETNFEGDLSVGTQFLVKKMLKYGKYLNSLFPQDVVYDKWDYLVTFEFNKMFWQQTLGLRTFIFYDISYSSVYLRVSMDYAISDNWKIIIGANMIAGKDPYDDFGQMEDNSNIYMRLRCSF